MGQITITPSYVDLSAGSAWSSLGSNTAAAQAAIGQVCSDIKNGTQVNGADIACTVKMGLDAWPTSAGDTTGQALGGNLGQSGNFISVNKTYVAFRNLLLGVTSKNTLQQSAWSIGNLPTSGPTIDGTTCTQVSLSMAALGLLDPTDSSYNNNQIVGGAGIATNSGVNQFGLDSGTSFYEVAFHEISECIIYRYGDGVTSFRLYPLDLFTYSGVGTRTVVQATTRWLSQDGGTTNIATLSTSGDAGDFAALANDAFNASGPNGPVSRSSSLPLQQRDWQALALYLPMSTNGNTWGGMSLPTSSVGLMSLRR